MGLTRVLRWAHELVTCEVDALSCPQEFKGALIAMKTTIAAGPPWVEAPSGPSAATIANYRARRSPIFGSTPTEREVLRDLRSAAQHSRAEWARRFGRAN